jgi:hypothetical protein
LIWSSIHRSLHQVVWAAGSIRFTPHQVLGQTSLENAPTPMKPFCGTRETLLKHARGNSVVNNAAAKDARRLT